MFAHFCIHELPRAYGLGRGHRSDLCRNASLVTEPSERMWQKGFFSHLTLVAENAVFTPCQKPSPKSEMVSVIHPQMVYGVPNFTEKIMISTAIFEHIFREGPNIEEWLDHLFRQVVIPESQGFWWGRSISAASQREDFHLSWAIPSRRPELTVNL